MRSSRIGLDSLLLDSAFFFHIQSHAVVVSLSVCLLVSETGVTGYFSGFLMKKSQRNSPANGTDMLLTIAEEEIEC